MTKEQAIAKSIKQAQETTPSHFFEGVSARKAAEAMYEIMNDQLTAPRVGWKVDMGRAREAETENEFNKSLVKSLKQRLDHYFQAAADYRAALEELENSKYGNATIYKVSKRVKGLLAKYPQPGGRSIDDVDF